MKNTPIRGLFLLIVLVSFSYVNAQILTKEDSLAAGLTGRTNSYSVLSGYGEAKASLDLRSKTGTANLTRSVIFFGHKFSNKVYFFSELELEHARVATGTVGEFSAEQLFLKFNVNPSNYFAAGLIIPRIGLTNENHLPTTFHGNDRPFVERFVIPSTWREMGIAYYGSSRKIRGLNYSAGIMNGLNNRSFSMGSGIRGGRRNGQSASISNAALTGALLYYVGNFRLQYSTYYGGTTGLNNYEADSLGLDRSIFGTPVSLNEANMRFSNKFFEMKALGAIIQIKDAKKINAAYKSNTPQTIVGGYFEAGLHLLPLFSKDSIRELTLFSRIETIDLNQKIAENGIQDDFQKQMYWVSGLTFAPSKGVVLKLDFVWRKTGQYNPLAYKTNPYSKQNPFFTTTNLINLGFGYSF